MRMGRLVAIVLGAVLISFGFPARSNGVDFAAGKSYPVGTNPNAIVAGDFNGDGKTDLAVGNLGSNDVSVLLSNGDGSFKTAVDSPAGISPFQIVAGDFNGDGKLDLVALKPGDAQNGVNGAVVLLLGKGDGTFQPPANISADGLPVRIAVADINEDNKLDLLITDNRSGLMLFLGKGDGTFNHSTVAGTLGMEAVVAEFSGDKHLDLIAAKSDSTNPDFINVKLLLLAGNGDGTFQPATTIFTLEPPSVQTCFPPDQPCQHYGKEEVHLPDYVLIGDSNSDGKPDLVVTYSVSKQEIPPCGRGSCHQVNSFYSVLFPGNGDGTVAPGNGFRATTGNIFMSDFNRDGKPDLAMGYLLNLGRGNGTFLALTPEWGEPQVVADLNGDTLPDVVVLGTNTIVVYLNTSQTSGSDLAVALGSTPPHTLVGGQFSYTATVTNYGPQDAASVALTESLPAGLNFVSANTNSGTCSGKANVTCELGAINDLGSATIVFTVAPASSGTFTDALHVAETTDLNSNNDSASFTVTATLPADIAVSGTASVNAASTGDKVTYTVQVTSAGPAAATNVVLTDAISDAGLTVSSLSISQGACAPAAGNISCEIGTISAGAKVNIGFTITVGPSEIVRNQLTVSTDTPEVVTGNNAATVDVTVNGANLAVVEKASANPAAAGTLVTYSVTVKNNGPTDAAGVIVNDMVPAGAKISAVRASQGSCAAPSGGVLSCSLGTLAVSASATLTLGATPAAGGTMTNVVNVKSDSVDPDTADNTATLDVSVQDFVITPGATSLTMTRGGLAKETLAFGAQGGFTGSLDLKCAVSGTAPMPSCGISPSAVPAGGTATLTVSAADLSAGLALESHGAAELSAVWLPFAVFGIVFTGHARRDRRGRWLLLALLMLSTVLPVACGGGSSQPIQQPQQFTVTVTAANSSTALEHTTTISVTVK